MLHQSLTPENGAEHWYGPPPFCGNRAWFPVVSTNGFAPFSLKTLKVLYGDFLVSLLLIMLELVLVHVPTPSRTKCSVDSVQGAGACVEVWLKFWWNQRKGSGLDMLLGYIGELLCCRGSSGGAWCR
jgi:hypothetical protein